jgi:hypothetical protein
MKSGRFVTRMLVRGRSLWGLLGRNVIWTTKPASINLDA